MPSVGQRIAPAAFFACLLACGCSKNAHLADAVRANDSTTAQHFLDAGADASARTKARWPVLVEASYQDNTSLAQQLLTHGAPVDAANPNGFTALMESSRNGNIGLVTDLLARHANVASVDSELGWNALILAAKYGRTPIVSLLIAAGADVNAVDKQGATALMRAAEAGHLEAAKALIAAHANVSYRTPTELASSAASEAIGNVENGAPVLQALLDAGVDVETQSWRGETLLSEAARLGNRDAALLLLERGADPNMVGGFYGETPLMYAAAHNDTELTKALLRAHAFIVAKVDDKQLCAICEAIEQTAPDTLDLLLKSGANPSFALADSKDTLLMLAVRAHNVRAIQLLLKDGADVMGVNADGKTAAVMAEEDGDADVQKALGIPIKPSNQE